MKLVYFALIAWILLLLSGLLWMQLDSNKQMKQLSDNAAKWAQNCYALGGYVRWERSPQWNLGPRKTCVHQTPSIIINLQ